MLDRVISMKFIDSFVVHVYCSAMNKSGTGPIEHATFLRKERLHAERPWIDADIKNKRRKSQ